MTVEPASTRANRSNSDSLDGAYIGISFTVGIRRARRVRGTVGIGDIDECLSLPVWQRLRDIRVRLETDSQKDDVRLDGFRQCCGNDLGSDRGRSGCKALRVARGGNGYFDAPSGKRLSKGVADLAEANN